MEFRPLNVVPLAVRAIFAAALGMIISCAQTAPFVTQAPVSPGSFASVRPVLETNCVHCHGSYRLANMPPMGSTRQLRSLIGPGNWIVPGKPEHSLFYLVVTFKDEQPGAMPPTGHAIAKAEVDLLRAWINAGAPVPDGLSHTLRPRGEPPRSR